MWSCKEGFRVIETLCPQHNFGYLTFILEREILEREIVVTDNKTDENNKDKKIIERIESLLVIPIIDYKGQHEFDLSKYFENKKYDAIVVRLVKCIGYCLPSNYSEFDCNNLKFIITDKFYKKLMEPGFPDNDINGSCLVIDFDLITYEKN